MFWWRSVDRLFGSRPRGTEERLHAVSPERREHGRAAIPCHRGTVGVVPEGVEVQVVSEPRAVHDLSEGIDIGWFAVRRQTHHLVLVAVVGKAEELCDRRVVDAERMGEADLAELFSSRPPSPMPHIALIMSPKPSMLTTAARSKGETK